MKQTSCPTSTGARNISRAPSQLDRARKQARQHDCAVGFITQHGAQVAFPDDSTTGDIWPLNRLGVESLGDAEIALGLQGWGFEYLEVVA